MVISEQVVLHQYAQYYPTNIMLHESATLSSKIERTEGIATEILNKYKITSKDILVIFSNSGVNQVPIESALFAKKSKM